jgi:hypothetical protein
MISMSGGRCGDRRGIESKRTGMGGWSSTTRWVLKAPGNQGQCEGGRERTGRTLNGDRHVSSERRRPSNKRTEMTVSPVEAAKRV